MIDLKQADDQTLFDIWQKGDMRGFSTLYDRYKNRVFGFLVRMTSNREIAEDLLQDTFLAAMRNATQFDRSRNFLSWIFGIAHKRTIDYFRHVKVENEHTEDAEKSLNNSQLQPDERLDSQNLNTILNDALKTLDPMQREVFLLRELGDVPFKDLAVMMDCPINTALGRMRLALKNIRKELKKRGIHGMQ